MHSTFPGAKEGNITDSFFTSLLELRWEVLNNNQAKKRQLDFNP